MARGKSIIEKYWDELDSIMDRLMADGIPSDNDSNESWKEYGEERGRAQSMAYAIAIIGNPNYVDVPAVKTEAMERWENRNAD